MCKLGGLNVDNVKSNVIPGVVKNYIILTNCIHEHNNVMLSDIQARLFMPGRLLCHCVAPCTQEKHYRLCFTLAKLLF